MPRKKKSSASRPVVATKANPKELTTAGAHPSTASELRTPSTHQLNELLGHYQNNNPNKARALATQLSQAFSHHPFAWKVLGAIALREGRIDEALSLNQKVVELSPSDAAAHNNLGNAQKASDKEDLAVMSYRRAIELNAQLPEAHYNLGSAFEKREKLHEAVLCYETATILNPDYFAAFSKLGNALLSAGRYEEAIAAITQAIKLQPTSERAHIQLGNAINAVQFPSSRRDLYEPLIYLLTHGNLVRPSNVSRAIANLLRQDPIIIGLIDQKEHLSDLRVLMTAIEDLAKLPLLHALMRACSLPNSEIEQAFAALRRALICNLSELQPAPSVAKVLSSLALHCFTNEYVYAKSDEEDRAVKALDQKLQRQASQGTRPAVIELLCLATYSPLISVRWLEKADIEILPVDVKRTFIEEPLIERDIANSMPCLKTVSDETSEKVRQQYEENPYPRWNTVPASPIRVQPHELIKHIGLDLAEDDFSTTLPSQILVAGCGTGQQPIEAALRYADAEITAVDLSLASLAYAQRKTQELGIKNIKYLQANILNISQLDTLFDVIECSGVLHHMEDPMAGWHALTNQLRTNGLMRIGLYSELARQHIVKTREEIAQHHIDVSASGIRNFRQALISSSAPHHAKLRSSDDFFNLSGVRDLIFNVQEHRFTALQLRENLDNLQLSFLGFENHNVTSKLCDYMSDEQDRRDLSAWHKLEEATPDLFAGMYQFWCQKD